MEAQEFTQNARMVDMALRLRQQQLEQEKQLQERERYVSRLAVANKVGMLNPNSPNFPAELKSLITKDPDAARLYWTDKEFKDGYIQPLMDQHNSIAKGIQDTLNKDGVKRSAYDYIDEDGNFNYEAIAHDRDIGQKMMAEQKAIAEQQAMRKGQQAATQSGLAEYKITPGEEPTMTFKPEKMPKPEKLISPAKEFAAEGYKMPLGDVLNAPSKKGENTIYKTRVNEAGEEDASGEFYKVIDDRGSLRIEHRIPVSDLEDYSTRLKEYNRARSAGVESRQQKAAESSGIESTGVAGGTAFFPSTPARKPETPSTELEESATTDESQRKDLDDIFKK